MIALGLSFYGKLLALLNEEFIFSLRNHIRFCLKDNCERVFICSV